MLRLRWIIGAAVVLVAALNFGRAADDEFDLRGPAPQKGQEFVSKGMLKIKDADTTLKTADGTTAFKLTLVVTVEEEVKVLEVDGRDVTKCQTKILRHRTEASNDKEKETHIEPSVLEKETVVSTRDGKKWKHALQGTNATEKQTKELGDRTGIDNDDDLYPKEKVKVGHAWTAEAAAFNKVLGDSFADLKGTMNQKFVRVEDIDGDKAAVVASSGKITGKMKAEGERTLDVALDLKVTVWKSLKTGVAVKEAYEGTIKLSGTTKDGNMNVEMTLNGPITSESTTKLVEQKK